MTYQQPALHLCQVSFFTHQIQPCHKTIQLWWCLCVGLKSWPCKVEVHEHRSCPVHYSYVLRTPLFNVSDTSPWLTQEGEGRGMNCIPLLFSCFWGAAGDILYRLYLQPQNNSKTSWSRDSNTLPANLELQYTFFKILLLFSPCPVNIFKEPRKSNRMYYYYLKIMKMIILE